jgi:chromosome segregation ATPase
MLRLGGGNIARIKSIIGQTSGQFAQSMPSVKQTPEGLLREFQRLSGEVSQQIALLANKFWTAALTEAASRFRDENARLRKHLEKVEADLVASNDRVVQIERERDGIRRDLGLHVTERDEFAQQCGDLKAAVRNAEGDLRAANKVIENFERNMQQDRSEIRQLQKRIEELVAKLAILKADSLRVDHSRKTIDRKRYG